MKIKLLPSDTELPLDECPAGLFLYATDQLGIKNDYGDVFDCDDGLVLAADGSMLVTPLTYSVEGS